MCVYTILNGTGTEPEQFRLGTISQHSCIGPILLLHPSLLLSLVFISETTYSFLNVNFTTFFVFSSVMLKILVAEMGIPILNNLLYIMRIH